MSSALSFLTKRSILEISGLDRQKFLQGLITNDITKASEKNLIYSVMLNSQGRFLYDFFIFAIGEKLILDCFAPRRDEILQKLNFYKLRSQIEIKKNDELLVAQSFENQSNQALKSFIDPRCKNIGYRIYGKKSDFENFTNPDEKTYHIARIQNKIPESENDLTYEKSFILEFGFDDLNAIDYNKGCYVGQELTARTHHLGQIRKKIFHIKIGEISTAEKNAEISCEGKSAGIILSSAFYNSELHALALIKLPDGCDFNDLKAKLEFEGKKIFIID
jgi:folate-binding protein YgfZ